VGDEPDAGAGAGVAAELGSGPAKALTLGPGAPVPLWLTDDWMLAGVPTVEPCMKTMPTLASNLADTAFVTMSAGAAP